MKASPKKKKISFSEKVRKKTEFLRRFFHKTLLIVNLVFVAALLLSYLSVFINPSVVAFPALFGLAYPYFALINLIFAVSWIAMWKKEALISIAALLLGIGFMNNFIRFRNHGEEVKSDIKMMSYNLRLFNYYEGTKGINSEKKILQLLKKENPGVLCLQEFYISGDTAQGIQHIKDALGGHWFTHVKMITRKNNKSYGIITLSRYPIIKRGEIPHPNSSSLSIYSDIIAKGDTLRIFNNHLQSFRLKRLESSFLEDLSTEINNGFFKNVKYIYQRLLKGFSSRSVQAEKVKEHITSSPYPVVVVGDFNDTPVSYTYRKIRRGLNDAFVEAGYGAGFTYRGKYPPNRIDFVFYDNKLECTDFDIIKVKYSDHYPIVTYFRKSH